MSTKDPDIMCNFGFPTASVVSALVALILLILGACGGETSSSTAMPTAAPTPPATDTPTAKVTTTAGVIDCSLVERIPPDSPEAREIGEALLAILPERQSPDLRQYTPTPFEFDEIRSIDRAGDWVLFQASFKRALEPAIFVLRATPSGYRYDGEGWGGQAESASEIRAYLASRLPEVAPELIACLKPAEWFLP